MRKHREPSLDAIRIVQANEKDVPAIKIIELESNLAPWALDDYLKELERTDSISLAAKCKEETIGFLIARLITSNYCGVGECELYNIAVKEHFRKKGIGQRLFDSLILAVRARGVRFILLEVRQTNLSAVRFYRKNGFRKIGERKNFYRFPVGDADILRLDLS